MPASPRRGRALRLLRDLAIGAIVTAQLSIVVPAVFPDGRAEAAGGNVTAKVAVNVRSGPGTGHSRLGVLYPGESLSIRGSTSNGWVPVTWRGQNVWVASAYVTGQGIRDSGSSATGATGAAWTQVRLNARTSPSLSSGVHTILDKGTQISLTGRVSGQWSQISLDSGTAWVATRYLGSSAPEQSISTPRAASVSTTATPETIGSRWGNAELNLWTAASGDRFVEVAPKGTEFKITGTVSGSRAQVVWKGAVRWVSARHLSDSAPAQSSPSGGETCLASFYSEDSATASGEPFDQWAMKTAHKTLPLGTKLRVTNPANGKSVDVTVNDRGPYVAGRCLDLTTGAFRSIADTRQGVAKVSYEIIN